MILRTLYLFILVLCLSACETEYEPDTSKFPIEYVVEGFIELSNSEPVPTYVFISRSFPFFDRIDENAISASFVRDAVVTVTKAGGQAVALTEVCLDELDPAIAVLIRERLLSVGAFADFCIYIDFLNEIDKQPNTQYILDIVAGSDRLTASTTIPTRVPADSVFHDNAAGNVADSLKDFKITITDPANEANFYRAIVGVNDLPLYSNNASVFDDVFISGKSLSFPLARPIYPGDEVDISTVGLFTVGDTAHLKWMSIDQPHYDFWASLEFDTNNVGPFASYTRASSNVVGGLGIWGGQSAYYYDYIIGE